MSQLFQMTIGKQREIFLNYQEIWALESRERVQDLNYKSCRPIEIKCRAQWFRGLGHKLGLWFKCPQRTENLKKCANLTLLWKPTLLGNLTWTIKLGGPNFHEQWKRNSKYDYPHIPGLSGAECLHQQSPDPDWDHLQEDGDGGDAGRVQCHGLRHRVPQQQQQEPGVHAQVLCRQDWHGGPL